MSNFAQHIEDVTLTCEDELGDSASITDGTVTEPKVPGYFRRKYEERLGDRFGLTIEAPTYECRSALLATLDTSDDGQHLLLTIGGRQYKVTDMRDDSHLNVLLVLSR